MAKTSRFLIFGDQSWPAESLGKFISSENDPGGVSLWIDGRGWIQHNKKDLGNLTKKSESHVNPIAAIAGIHFSEAVTDDMVAIVGFQDSESAQAVVDSLKSKSSGIKILQVGSRESRCAINQTKRSVAWKDLISRGVDEELTLLSLQNRVRDLRNLFKESESVALLLQDDPDPDGLASALALRKILGRKAQTAPILTFGGITRPENVAMVKLLGIEVEKIERDSDLLKYSGVVMIDCQPSFFRGHKIRVDAIVDHHPKPQGTHYDVPFEEIRQDLGATSSLMTLLLRAAGEVPSQRLATALLYGIKSDTLALNREVSESDLDSFVFLYPLMNGNTLRRIERPELPREYLEELRKGLKFLKSAKGITVLPVPSADREEWIPQAADFALQIEETLWSVGVGVYQDNVVLSGRNCGYVHHCGEVFKELFDVIGVAGGHKTMAKAIIPKNKWSRRFGAGSTQPKALVELIMSLLDQAIEKRNLERDQEKEANLINSLS